MGVSLKLLAPLLLVALYLNQAACEEDSSLVAVIVVLRHGARSPLRFYANDPYKDDEYWPDGLGALSKRGTLQMYQLGKWLRRRYDGFLPRRYHQSDVYVRSTDIDRTLMSAQAALAGLYPPRDGDAWNPHLQWRPIPVHTVPTADDIVVRNELPCPTYHHLYMQLMYGEEMTALNHTLRHLYAYLTEHSGTEVHSLLGINDLYDTISIEDFNNLTLPQWARAVYPDRMLPWVNLHFAVSSFTPELARLRTGPLINDFIEYFNAVLARPGAIHRMKIYSGHDSTISNLLQTLGALQYHQPPFASAVMLELRRDDARGRHYLNLVYKNSTEPQNMTVKGCEFDCDYDKFVKLMQPVAITSEQWKEECGFPTDNVEELLFSLLIVIGSFSLCLMLTVVYLIVRCVRLPKGKAGAGENVVC